MAGKGEREAAELLLHYLHRAFPYKTDEAQFGIERTLFAEEMYYYPYSDCEDRSILLRGWSRICWGWMSCCSIIRRISPRRYASKAR